MVARIAVDNMKSDSGIETLKSVAHPWLCDAMGHMSARYIYGLFDDAAYIFFAAVGGGPRELSERSLGWADVKVEIEYHEEIRGGDTVSILSGLERLGNKSVSSWHVMTRQSDGKKLSSAKLVTVQFDLSRRCAVALDAGIRKRLEARLEPSAGRE
jgi:acyl-CoA thioester hydrolase